MDSGTTNASNIQAGFSDIATVYWLGYDTPEYWTTGSDNRANQGAANIQRFLGLEWGSLFKGKHLTLIGHSYGTLVLGYAIRKNRQKADDVIFVGSPGVGAYGIDDLYNYQREGRARVWAGAAPGDPVVDGGSGYGKAMPDGWFGPSPSNAGWGARTIDTSVNSSGHSEYFKPFSSSLQSIQRIVLADPLCIRTNRCSNKQQGKP